MIQAKRISLANLFSVFLAAITLSANEAAVAAYAQTSCLVSDPTGTPLNIREAPNGRVIAALRNGQTITATDYSTDNRGKRWAYVQSAQ